MIRYDFKNCQQLTVFRGPVGLLYAKLSPFAEEEQTGVKKYLELFGVTSIMGDNAGVTDVLYRWYSRDMWAINDRGTRTDEADAITRRSAPLRIAP